MQQGKVATDVSTLGMRQFDGWILTSLAISIVAKPLVARNLLAYIV